ncbi:MAG: HNH endonuclease [Verrucomicrobia bacterium]|nr:HNH endonuclease [Verrucomicrobiota bacterium]
MPDQHAELRFQLDHNVPEQHGGPSTPENLAWACPRCNKHKGPNLAGLDPESGAMTPLFHPCVDVWREHFFPGGVRGLPG